MNCIYILPRFILLCTYIVSVVASEQQVFHSNGFSTDQLYHEVPSFTYNDLENGDRDNDLKKVLTTNGLIAIKIPTKNPGNLLKGMCECISEVAPMIEGGDKRLLADGLTTRSTIATATQGVENPLPLPKSEITKNCDNQTYESIERARDYVSFAAHEAFMPAMDRLIKQATRNSDNKSILKTKYGKNYDTLSSVVADAVNLEHFHVYSKGSDNRNHRDTIDEALDWHTDGGVFLAFLPAQSCMDNDTNQDESFKIKINGSDLEQTAIFPNHSNDEIVVGIMLGAGAERWLDLPQSLNLKATRHAVKMRGGDIRSWYGMMHLVATDAIVETTPKAITFSELKKFSSSSSVRRFSDRVQENEITFGCGDLDDDSVQLARNNIAVPSRRRLQHVGGPSDCSNNDNFFCWMSCMDVPSDDQSFLSHVHSGENLYCLDPAVLAETNDLKEAVAACSDSIGVAGGIHRAGCKNVWAPSEIGVPTYTSLYVNNEQKELKYCYGSTGMYMHGFEWESSTCIIYLFGPLTITSRSALSLACIGTIVFGILVEFVIRKRRTVLRGMQNGIKKILASAFLYGSQLTLSYLIMLVIMTYSGPLFISVILGLVIGHTVFHWNDFMDKNALGEVALEGSTPCCTNVLDEPSSFIVNSQKSISDDDDESKTIQNCCA